MKCKHIFTLVCQIYFFWLPESGTNANHTDRVQGIAPTVPLDGIWQLVSGSRDELFVYSAYVERRFRELAIRIVAIALRTSVPRAQCRLTLPNATVVTLRATNEITREHHDLNYSASFIYCTINNALQVSVGDLLNSSVEVIIDAPTETVVETHEESNLLRILDTKVSSTIKNEVHICVRSLNSAYSRAEWLVEWFELNLLMGVSHFYMYNQSMAENVSCVLDHYRRLGVVTLLPWNLPVSPKMIHADGQLANSNDCLYRSMPHAEWLLNIDVDEVVFPRPRRSLQDHFNILSRSVKKDPSEIVFRHAFFYMFLDDCTQTKASQYPLLTSRKTRRLAVTFDRHKYAVRPNHAIELGIHRVTQLTYKHFALIADPQTGILHHYREVCVPELNCSGVEIEADNDAVKWADDLYRRVKLRQDILNSCLPLTEL